MTPPEAECLARMSRAMLERGLIMPALTSSSCSTAMTERDIDVLLEAFSKVLAEETDALARLAP